jgi:hypothetical protein
VSGRRARHIRIVAEQVAAADRRQGARDRMGEYADGSHRLHGPRGTARRMRRRYTRYGILTVS